jgi:hypothetical protein
MSGSITYKTQRETQKNEINTNIVCIFLPITDSWKVESAGFR